MTKVRLSTGGRSVTGVVTVGLVALLASACGSSGGGGGKQTVAATVVPSASVAANADFYNGKTITWDVPGKVGSGFYTSAQILAPVIGKYLHSTINVVSLPAGDTVVGQNTVAAAKADGLTIGTLATKDDLFNDISGEASVNFQIADMSIIGGLPQNLQVLVVNPSSPWKSYDDLVKSKGPLTSVNISGDLLGEEKLLFGAYGVKATYRTGYASLTDSAAGYLRGDAKSMLQDVSNIASIITSGKARPILLSGPPSPDSAAYAQIKDLPTFSSYVKQNPPADADAAKALKLLVGLFGSSSYNLVPFAPKGVPADRVAALSTAFKYALGQPSVKTAYAKADLVDGFIDPITVRNQLNQVISNVGLLKNYVK